MYTKVQVKGLPSYAIRRKKRTAHIDVYLNERNLILMMIKDKCTYHITLAMFRITLKIEIVLTFVSFFFLLVLFECSETNFNFEFPNLIK